EAPTPNHTDTPCDEKESRRWLEAAELAAPHLAPGATQVIMVADREGDIYPMFARRPEAIDFVVRACHNRVLAEGGTLFAAPAAWPALGRVQVKVAPKRPGDKGRKARIVLKARTVTIKRPNSTPDRRGGAKLTLGAVEGGGGAAAARGEPLLWRGFLHLARVTEGHARRGGGVLCLP